MYVSLSYGRGWNYYYPFAPGDIEQSNCPFEAGTMLGISCGIGADVPDLCTNLTNPDDIARCLKNSTDFTNGPFVGGFVVPPAWGLVAKITIPEDMKLIASDNSVVGDELCVGDSFKLVKGVDKGEYWQDGGHEDSPPIYWVDDVEAVVDQILVYHEDTVTTKNSICANKAGIANGFVDPLTGVPIYQLPVDLHYCDEGANLAGNMLCSIKKKGEGLEASDYFVVKEKKDIGINDDYVVECTYYYYGGSDGCMYYLLGQKNDVCPFETLKVPTVIQAGPDATYGDWGTQGNAIFTTKEEFFKVGEIKYAKTIKVVDPAKAGLEITVLGAESLKYGEENNLRLVLKNTGNADESLRAIKSNVKAETISCDSETISPDQEVECILSLTPEKGERVELIADYKYKSCGRIVLANSTLELMYYTDLNPVASTQAYGFDVYGDCRNDYFGCDAPSRKGTFVAGYRCFNKDGKYNVPSVGRFDLKYDLSTVPKGKDILGARLYLNAKTVHKEQALTVYSTTNNKWKPAGCTPGGDICAQPWCKACLPLYDFAGAKGSSVYIEGDGEYSLDVSDYVKAEIGKGEQYASFQLMGQEDEWSTDGEKTCAAVGQWTSQEVEFYGTGSSGPYLEVVYK